MNDIYESILDGLTLNGKVFSMNQLDQPVPPKPEPVEKADESNPASTSSAEVSTVKPMDIASPTPFNPSTSVYSNIPSGLLNSTPPPTWTFAVRVSNLKWFVKDIDMFSLISHIEGPPYIKFPEDHKNGILLNDSATILCPSEAARQSVSDALDNKEIKGCVLSCSLSTWNPNQRSGQEKHRNSDHASSPMFSESTPHDLPGSAQDQSNYPRSKRDLPGLEQPDASRSRSDNRYHGRYNKNNNDRNYQDRYQQQQHNSSSSPRSYQSPNSSSSYRPPRHQYQKQNNYNKYNRGNQSSNRREYPNKYPPGPNSSQKT